MSSGAIAAGLAPCLRARPQDLAPRTSCGIGWPGAADGPLHAPLRPSRTWRRKFCSPWMTSPGEVTTATRTGRSADCWSSGLCLSSTRTTPWRHTRSGSATTTGWRHWSRTWCTLTLILLSDVDALYTERPTKPTARKITDVRNDDDLERVDFREQGCRGRHGGMITKVDGPHRRVRGDSGRARGGSQDVQAALQENLVGTLFHPTGPAATDPAAVAAPRERRPRRPGARSGCCASGRARNASLLPAGITAVRGRSHPVSPSIWRIRTGW